MALGNLWLAPRDAPGDLLSLQNARFRSGDMLANRRSALMVEGTEPFKMNT